MLSETSSKSNFSRCIFGPVYTVSSILSIFYIYQSEECSLMFGMVTQGSVSILIKKCFLKMFVIL